MINFTMLSTKFHIRGLMFVLSEVIITTYIDRLRSYMKEEKWRVLNLEYYYSISVRESIIKFCYFFIDFTTLTFYSINLSKKLN